MFSPSLSPAPDPVLRAAYLHDLANFPGRHTSRMAELAALPVHREPVLRADASTETILDALQARSKRAVNWEAALSQTTGMEMDVTPCRHCQKGCGPFAACVVATGMFGGSCGNCHWQGMGRRCSNRRKYRVE